jgi:hypothetical protein
MSLKWDFSSLADRLGEIVAAAEAELRLEQAVYGLDARDERDLQALLAERLGAWFEVAREVHYPSSRGNKLTHRMRCDLVLCPSGKPLRVDPTKAAVDAEARAQARAVRERERAERAAANARAKQERAAARASRQAEREAQREAKRLAKLRKKGAEGPTLFEAEKEAEAEDARQGEGATVPGGPPGGAAAMALGATGSGASGASGVAVPGTSPPSNGPAVSSLSASPEAPPSGPAASAAGDRAAPPPSGATLEGDENATAAETTERAGPFCDPADALWLEVKVAYQFREGGARHGGYGAQWRQAVVTDLQKMEAEPLVREAGLVLVVFNESAAVLEKDLELFEDVLARREVLAGFRQVRTVKIQDRIGHAICTVAVWPTVQR